MERQTNRLRAPAYDNRLAVIIFCKSRATLFYPGRRPRGGIR